MSGVTNTGVVGYIANPIRLFPANSLTIDIFGNVFYRNYVFGAGDDTGVYWNETNPFSPKVMLFVGAAIEKSLSGKFSYGNKLRSSQSHDFEVNLPTKNGQLDVEFIERFVAELEAYLKVTGLDDTSLTAEEGGAIAHLDEAEWVEVPVAEFFAVKNTSTVLSRDVIPGSGAIPYVTAMAENNSVSSYIAHDNAFLEEGNCVFIGGKTFVVSYQPFDFFSNDSHNLALYAPDKLRTRLSQLFLATCVRVGMQHKYSWGNSISNRKIQDDVIAVPMLDGTLDVGFISVLMTAVQKLVVDDVVRYTADRLNAAREIVGGR